MNLPKALCRAAGIGFAAYGMIAAAQDPANNNGGPQGQRPNFDEIRQRMTEQLKSTLKVSDEEWALVQPLIEKIFTKQREAGGRFGGFGFGPPPGGGQQPSNGAPQQSGGSQGGPPPFARNESPERQALREALEKDSTSADELKAKLTAVREQRQKAAAELAAAREDLRKLLTVRQEATLVAVGILE